MLKLVSQYFITPILSAGYNTWPLVKNEFAILHHSNTPLLQLPTARPTDD